MLPRKVLRSKIKLTILMIRDLQFCVCVICGG